MGAIEATGAGAGKVAGSKPALTVPAPGAGPTAAACGAASAAAQAATPAASPQPAKAPVADAAAIANRPDALPTLVDVVEKAKAAQAAQPAPPAQPAQPGFFARLNARLDAAHKKLEGTSAKLQGANEAVARGAQSLQKGVTAGAELARGAIVVGSAVHQERQAQAYRAALLSGKPPR